MLMMMDGWIHYEADTNGPLVKTNHTRVAWIHSYDCTETDELYAGQVSSTPNTLWFSIVNTVPPQVSTAKQQTKNARPTLACY
jgi:hypothetical protein